MRPRNVFSVHLVGQDDVTVGVDCLVEGKGAAVLVAKGADPNATDVYGNTPLKYAYRNKSGNMVQILTSKGSKGSKGSKN